MKCNNCHLIYPEDRIFCTNCRIDLPNKLVKLKELAWMPLFLIGLPGMWGLSNLIVLIFFGKDEHVAAILGLIVISLWSAYMYAHMYRVFTRSLFASCNGCHTDDLIPIHICPRCGGMDVRTELRTHGIALASGLVIMWLAFVIGISIFNEMDSRQVANEMCFLLTSIITVIIAIPLILKFNAYGSGSRVVANGLHKGTFEPPWDRRMGGEVETGERGGGEMNGGEKGGEKNEINGGGGGTNRPSDDNGIDGPPSGREPIFRGPDGRWK